MSDKNVAKHSLRLNLRNEQHLRIQKVLSSLDKDIYKSENQFIVNALDFYISSFDNDDIMGTDRQKAKPEFVTREELAGIGKEIKSEVKDEIIRLLGAALVGGQPVAVPERRTENIQRVEQEESPVVTDLANQWG